MKWLFILFLAGLSPYSRACSSSASMGFCQNIINDSSCIVLGVKLGNHIIYDSTGETSSQHVTYHGMPFKIIETLRGTIPHDTVTVWNGYYYMCSEGTLHLSIGDTFLLQLYVSNFSADSLENLPDYDHPDSWPFPTYLEYHNDTLRGLIYQDYMSHWTYPPDYTHPEARRAMTVAPYQDFKENIQNGLVCYDYTSIKNTELNALNVYPNPCTNVLHLDTETEHDVRITLHDAMGKALSKDLPVRNGQLDVSFLKPGIYFLNIQDGQGSKPIKFLKQAG